jgi:hypothetical protein
MLRGLVGFAIVAGESTITEVEKRNLLHPHYFPVPLEGPQINRPQALIIAIGDQWVKTSKREFIVPWHDLFGRKLQLLTDC